MQNCPFMRGIHIIVRFCLQRASNQCYDVFVVVGEKNCLVIIANMIQKYFGKLINSNSNYQLLISPSLVQMMACCLFIANTLSEL